MSIAEPKDWHLSLSKMALRSTEASPKVRALCPWVSVSIWAIAVLLIVPAASPAAVMSVAGPQAEAAAFQRRSVMLALAPPWSIEYSMSRSPCVRTLFGPVAQVVGDWLNSKSISVVPLGSETRAQYMCR